MKKPQQYQQKVTAWMWNYSSFVYAPCGTILGGGYAGTQVKTSIPLSDAKRRWLNCVRDENNIPKVVSVDNSTAEVVPHFWLYKEEFIDFENRPKDTTHPKFETIKSKGRIGMFVPIHPIEVKVEHHLEWIDVPDDSVGWGVVGNIGQSLEVDQVPTTWKNLQASIGKYILLTNVWSSESADEYEVFVDSEVVKKLYKDVCVLTKGDMFVNVRRGCMPYGPLCVLRRNIVVDPRDDKFGLKGGDKLNLYVTQILACGNTLTQHFMRKQIKEYWKNQDMSDEERQMCSIVQTFNKNHIDRMKNEMYRNMMIKYWKTPANWLDGMTDGNWDVYNMRLLILNMLSTAYNLILERGVSKVACRPRYMYLSHLFTNFPHWFQKTKCLPNIPIITRPAAADIDSHIKMSTPQPNGYPRQAVTTAAAVDPLEEQRKKQALHVKMKLNIRGAYLQMRTQLAYEVYERIYHDQTSMTIDQKFDTYFESLWEGFYRQMTKAERADWLSLEETDPAVNV